MAWTQLVSDTSAVVWNAIPFLRYAYEGSAIACPICSSPDARELCRIDRRLKRLTTVVCEGCGLLFTNPMPNEDDLAAYYKQLYRLDYQMSWRPHARHVNKRTREAGRRCEAIADLLAPGARSLDFGAGSGEFVLAMLARGFDAYGFDPGLGFASHAREKLGNRIAIKSWQEVEGTARFDLVTSFHVLEHLRDPLSALRAAASWLRPEGLLSIEVPDVLRDICDKGFGSFPFRTCRWFQSAQSDLRRGASRFDSYSHYRTDPYCF